jgi:hypothetical protein
MRVNDFINQDLTRLFIKKTSDDLFEADEPKQDDLRKTQQTPTKKEIDTERRKFIKGLAAAGAGTFLGTNSAAVADRIRGDTSRVPQVDGEVGSSPDSLNSENPQYRQTVLQQYLSMSPLDASQQALFYHHVRWATNNFRQLDSSTDRRPNTNQWRSRGFIQLTGPANYQEVNAALRSGEVNKLFKPSSVPDFSGYDIVANPDLLVTNVPLSAAIAIYWWLRKETQDKIKRQFPKGKYFDTMNLAYDTPYSGKKVFTKVKI